LSLDNDAVKAMRAYAQKRRVSLSKAASELSRRGSRYQIPIRMVNGLPVLDAPDTFPSISSEQVRKLQAKE
jgi:hypothetical protein